MKAADVVDISEKFGRPRGSGDWFRALFLSHAGAVRGLVLRLGCRGSEADDLVQEVFLLTYRRFGAGETMPAELRSPKGWLHGVAVRVVADARKRDRVRRFWQLRAPPVEPERRTPGTSLDGREDTARLHRLLETLSEKKRTVFVLFEIEQLSGKEIADILRVPLKTVWARLIHARREFRRALAREELRMQRELSGGRQ